MTVLLQINASPRSERSLTRKLSSAFVEAWRAKEPSAGIIVRDIGVSPPPFVSEAWIGAAFTSPDGRTPQQHDLLRASDEMIDELTRADILVMATPMYNYGMPATLKAWFDQVIRVNRTFSFDLARGDYPLEPILRGKTLVILASRGEFGFEPGGVRQSMNHLETHIRVAARYLGVETSHLIAIDYQEFGDHRHERSVAEAFAEIPRLVEHLTAAAQAA